MTDDVRQELERRALAGRERGADAVWRAAGETARPATALPGRSRHRLVLVAAVAAVAVAAGLAGLALDRGPAGTDLASGPADTSVVASSLPPAQAGPTDGSAQQTPATDGAGAATGSTADTSGAGADGGYRIAADPVRSAAYRTCALELDAEVGLVEVLAGSGGLPVAVKTDPEVPAEVHGPCFALVGGSVVPGRSSWGATVLADCDDPTTADDGSCVQRLAEQAPASAVGEAGVTPDEALSGRYRDCVAGHAPDLAAVDATVYRTGGGKVAGLVTDVDVPPAVHGRCYALIGGLVLSGQSSGRQTWVRDCGVDVEQATPARPAPLLDCAQELVSTSA